jgi:hypothetical protein
LTLNAVRSVTLDVLHHRTGVKHPELDFSDFQGKFWAFNQLVESHWRYYQFYSHMFLAVALSVAIRLPLPWESNYRLLLAVAPLEIVLLISARVALARYYASAALLLGTLDEIREGERKVKKRGVKALDPETS